MAKKSKKRRKVLAASCILAALIVAGSSFAWFTSSDEVTNRLSANADYNVTIAENFTPPENWVPGQEIDKDVAVVNTGNVDAFVRTWLEGEMNLLAQVKNKSTWDTTNFKFTDQTTTKTDVPFTSLTASTDDTLKNTGMTYSYKDNAGNGSAVYLKELSKVIYANPNDPTAAQSNPADFNEVQGVQAGGVLAYTKTSAAAGDTVFIYTPNNSNTFKSGTKKLTYEVNGGQQYSVKIDTGVAATTVFNVTNENEGDDIYVDAATKTIYVKAETDIVKYLGNCIDSDDFYPAATGLYIFNRNVNMSTPSSADYEFSGYYYVKSGTEAGQTGTDTAATIFGKQGQYYALQNETDSSNRSDNVLPDGAINVTENTDGTITVEPTTSLALYTAQQNVLENSNLKWTYYKAAAFNNGAAYYTDGSDWFAVGTDTALPDGAIKTALGSETATPMFLVTDGHNLKIDVVLANNITSAVAAGVADAEKWTPMNSDGVVTAATSDASTKAITFYYNNDVEEGATTSRLVDKLQMDSTVTQYDYIAFDFDLNVFSDSIQVTLDNTGAEQTTSVNPWAANNGNGNTAVAAKGTKGNILTDTEITYITWAANA